MSAPLAVCALHHEVIEAWARLRRELVSPVTALTFDHHNDTLPAFLHVEPDETARRKLLNAATFRSDGPVRAALARLRHDEHIDFALETGIISDSVIVAHYDHGGAANGRMRVTAPPQWPPVEVLLNAPEEFRGYADRVFEAEFLEARLAAAGFVPEEHPGFIFDLDLDYVLTARALTPGDPSMLKRLLANAGLITVSREEEWLRLLKIDAGIDSESLLGLFRKFL